MTEQLREALALLRRPEVQKRCGLSRSQLYALIAAKRFPAPVTLAGSRSVAWSSDCIAEWITSQISAGRKVA